MSNIFIFHGTGGYPQENWFPWLKAELEAKGHKVYIPEFPTPKGQSLKAWLEVLQPYEDKINKDSILIGHSLGGLFLLRVLERLQTKVKMAIFVGAPIGIKPIKFYENDEKFSGFDFTWQKITTKADQFIVFHSDNDPYVSLANGELLAKKLGTNLNFIPNAGHFNTASGYTKFEELLKRIIIPN